MYSKTMRQQNIPPIDVQIPFDLASALVKATATLTSDNTQVTEGSEIVVGSKTYVFKATELTAAVAATAVLTSDNTNVTAGKKVTLGDEIYTYVAALTVVTSPRQYVPNEVLIGADADASMNNLIDAINEKASTKGTKYSLGTVKNALASAGTLSAHAFTVTALTAGTGGNAIAKAEDDAHLDWDGTGGFLTGGVDTIENEVLIGADADGSLNNLIDAINGTDDGETTGPGITYGVGTTANADVTAGAVADHATLMTAKVGGIVGNSIAKSEDDAHLDWDGAGATFTGGGSTKGKYVFTKGGFAHRFITVIGTLTGTITTAIGLYNEDDVLLKALQATQAEGSTVDTAYEVEIKPGDYILCTASATTSDAEEVGLHVR